MSAEPAAAAAPYPPGSLIHARGRDWIALPSGDHDLLRLRPVTAGGGEEIGIHLPLERPRVRPASFIDPDPERPGDAAGIGVLFDAARLSLRSGAAPFRSLGHISVVPRPYQFVPLLMALRLDPIRLLIADDVGVGKTIEAGLIAREALDRGIVRRLAVLCPAHLCDQWQRELFEKFSLEAELVQPSQLARLERRLPRQNLSIYAHFPHFVASIDLLKSKDHRDRFLSHAPDLVIVDEAHIAERPRGDAERTQHQRYDLVRALAADGRRHLLLVTATPHSGIEESFRSLLGLLDPAFDRPPDQPLDRAALRPHLIQRRRGDVERWMGADTPFPKRASEERRYDLSPEYRALFRDVLAYCQETLAAGTGLRAAQQRVRLWAAIAILRCVLSSPAAAEAVLANRAGRLAPATDPGDGVAGIDAVFRPQVLDALGDDETSDHAPAGPLQEAVETLTDAEQRRLTGFLKRARALAGAEQDRKLARLAEVVRELLADGHRPIVFCRFIPTAKYVAEHLPRLLGREVRGMEIRAVTGKIGDEERREKIAEITGSARRLLVATDCLSEGINLQDHFDAVVHYDLPWNPNRLEQREGRVDRFGQRRGTVRTVLLYGTDTEIDHIVLDVLIRKAERIRRTLGIAVPVPVDAEEVLRTVVDAVLLRRPHGAAAQLQLALDTPDVSRLHRAWDVAAERETKARAWFAQTGIQPDAVQREIATTDAVLGDGAAVRRFLADALQRLGGGLTPVRDRPGAVRAEAGRETARLKALSGLSLPAVITFDRRLDDEAVCVGRTHPLVDGLCGIVLGHAFAPAGSDLFARCGAMRTNAVELRTALLLLRLRYRLAESTGASSDPIEVFAEEVVLAAVRRGTDGGLDWLEPLDDAGRDLAARAAPTANMTPAERSAQVRWALDLLHDRKAALAPLVAHRTKTLAEAHRRIRTLAQAAALTVIPHEPPDLLGCFVLVPG